MPSNRVTRLLAVIVIAHLPACGLKKEGLESRRTSAKAASNGTSQDAKSVTPSTVTNPSPQPPASAGDLSNMAIPSCSLTAASNLVQKGGKTTLILTVNGKALVALIDGSSTNVAGGTKEISVSESKTYVASVMNAGGSAECGVSITAFDPVPETPTCALSANPATISTGGSSALALTTSGVVSSFTLDNAVVTADNFSKGVSPTATTTYVGKITGPGGSSSCSVTISVNAPALPPAPSCSLTLSPSSVTAGNASQLKLTVTGSATAASLDGNPVGVAGVTTSVSPAQTKVYKATVTGAGGNNSCETTLTVVPKVPAAPTCTLSASPSSLDFKNKPDVTLTVLTLETAGSNTKSEIVGLTVNPTGGRIEVGDHPAATKTYVGQVTGPGGSSTCTATVNVVPAATPTPPPPANVPTKLQITSAADSGPGSLREAILRLNNDPNTDPVVDCPLAGSGSIHLLTDLPPLTRAKAVIDCRWSDTATGITIYGNYGLIVFANDAILAGFQLFTQLGSVVSANGVLLHTIKAVSGTYEVYKGGITLANSNKSRIVNSTVGVGGYGIIISGGSENQVANTNVFSPEVALVLSDTAKNEITGGSYRIYSHDGKSVAYIVGNSPGNILSYLSLDMASQGTFAGRDTSVSVLYVDRPGNIPTIAEVKSVDEYFVTNSSDSLSDPAPGSLRWALGDPYGGRYYIDGNGNKLDAVISRKRISFFVPTPPENPVVTIALKGVLTVKDIEFSNPVPHHIGMLIDGSTQPGNDPLNNRRSVQIWGGNAGVSDGVVFNSVVSEISDIAINGFHGAGIKVYAKGSSQTTLRRVTIGMDASGVAPMPNDGDGVRCVFNSNPHQALAVDQSLISGNGGNGIYGEQNCSLNVTNSLIGLDSTGNLAAGNNLNGIVTTYYLAAGDCSNAAKGNMIAANKGFGIDVEGQSQRTDICSNILGYAKSGVKLPNLAGQIGIGPNSLVGPSNPINFVNNLSY